MLADNETPFAAIAFDQWHPSGQTMTVVAARAKLMIAADGTLRYAPHQNLVLADQWAGDPHKTSMTVVGDLVPYRPAADVTVLGSLKARDPDRYVYGGIRVGTHQHIVRGSGPREWIFTRGAWHLTEPAPIDEVPLCYSYASGGRVIGAIDGAVDPRNPVGAGVIDPLLTPKHLHIPAARLDSEAAPLSLDPTQSSLPEGLGPISPWWLNRSRHAGTYDEDWLRDRHPRLPTNFDWRFYQVAHPALILPGYLMPGQRVDTFGLTDDGGALGFSIPDLVPVARFSFTDGRAVEARLHLDGLHLDLREKNQTVDLTWRTWIETCPALYRADLKVGRSADVLPLCLPVAGAHGLQLG